MLFLRQGGLLSNFKNQIMKKFKNILFATIITLFVTSCTDNSLDELVEVQEETTTSTQAKSSDTGGSGDETTKR